MKTKINLKILSYACILITFSCTKNENLSIQSKSSNLTAYCSPGNTSIENGMLKFENGIEFSKTLDFLNCANADEINSWENGLSIMTTSKWYKQFKAQLCNGENCPELTEVQLDLLINEFEGKIKITGDAQDREYRIKFLGFNEFANEQGYFKIGSSLIALTDTKLVSIIDGNPSKVQVALSTNQTNLSEGIFIHDLAVISPPPLCVSPCPISDCKDAKVEDNEYRYKICYGFTDLTTTFAAALCSYPNVDQIFRISLDVNGAAEKHRWLRGWVCSEQSRTAHSWTGEMQINHNFSNFPSPVIWNLNRNWDWNCFVSTKTEFRQSFLCIHPLNIPTRSLCLEKVVLNATATRRNININFNCQ